MTMTEYNLDQIMLHARTMRLIDRVISHTDTSVIAEVTITKDSTFLNGDHVPAWVGLEYAAQGVAALSGIRAHERGIPHRLGFLLSCRRFRCDRDKFMLGDVIEIHADEEFNDNKMGGYKCALRIDGQEVATVTLSAYIPDDLSEMTAGI